MRFFIIVFFKKVLVRFNLKTILSVQQYDESNSKVIFCNKQLQFNILIFQSFNKINY